MSEQAPKSPQTPEPAPVSVERAFDPDLRQGQKDLDEYMASRPYQDAKGNVHDPVNNGFVNPDQYFDAQREAAYEANGANYANMPTSILAKKWAQAEFNQDRTSVDSIEDALLDKAVAQENREKERDPGRPDDESGKLLDHLNDIKERELQKMIEESIDPDANNGNSSGHRANTNAKDPEKKEKFTVKDVYYDPEDDGTSQTAAEISDEGYALHLDQLHGRPTLLTAGDTTYYVSGNYINDLEKMKQPEPQDGEEWKFDGEQPMPKITVGKPLVIDGKEVGGPITKVEISGGRKDFDGLQKNADFESRGEDPFGKAYDILKDAYGWGEEPTALLEAGETRPKLRERIRNAMLRAAVAVQSRTTSVREFYGDKERGDGRKAVSAVIGATALFGIGLAVSKGVPLLDGGHDKEIAPHLLKPNAHQHVQEAIGGGTPAPITPEEHVTLAPGAGDGGTAAVNPVRLHPGQNPWTVSEHRLQELGLAHPTDPQIEAYDKAMAQMNPDVYKYAGESSENIPVGTVLKLPR